MASKNFKIIDCTLRDGGYYNNWNFSPIFINDFLNYISKLPIDYVELGFRFCKSNKNLGKCAYTSENFINKLKIPKNLDIGVMINAADYSYDNFKLLETTFIKRKLSKIKLVRLATHLKDFEESIKISIFLKNLGYMTAINLMQISEISSSDLIKCLKKINKNNADIFYIADSLGSLEHDQIKQIFKSIKKNIKLPFGIHTHNNMGQAFENTKQAILSGSKYVDSSFNGMGRGPGNCKTEELILYYKSRDQLNQHLKYIAILNDRWFNSLKKKYNWGSNIYYFLSARLAIHPSYVQALTAEQKYLDEDIFKTLLELTRSNPTKFDEKKIYNINTELLNYFKDKNSILIIGNGGSSNKKFLIKKYIKKYDPLVLCLNYNFFIDSSLIDFYIISNLAKLIIEIENFKKIKNKIICSNKNIYTNASKKLNKNELFHYPTIIKQSFNQKNLNIVPNNLSLTFALTLANLFKCKKVALIGIDGYENDEARNLEIINTINNFKSTFKQSKIHFLIKPINFNV